MKLQDSVIAITGGGQGLGRAMAEYLAAKGARLALIDLMPEKLEEAAAACKKAGGDARTYICNVAKEDDVEKTFEAIVADFGQLNGLINNAGILRDGLMVKVKDGQVEKRMELSQWQSVIDVNLTGVFLCGREASTQMIKNGDQGAIINIASISRAGNMGQSNYSAAKAGVSALVPVWAKELARYGIRCMGIAPGFIETEMTASMKPEALEKMTAGIPLK
ncbi:SDR family NAD(P)-dependent oxidoreductase, partial [Marinobacter salarius]